MTQSIDAQTKKLLAGTAQVLPEQEFLKKLAKRKPLRIKLGVDPTAPDLHLGHAVVLEKLKQFEDAGHTVIFLIGDFTAQIGDPTGRSKTRMPLSEEQIKHNAKTYFDQVGRILNVKKIEIRYNSEWLGDLDLSDWLKIAGKVTLSRIIEREDFARRIQEQTPVGFHELFYPLMQGYDSVALKADVELGGTDQTFNLLMGRHLQEHFEQEPQVIMTLPLLEGLDGEQKMSKSLGNHIGIAEPADTAFGKLMSVSDTLMWRYYHLLLGMTSDQVKKLQDAVSSGKEHPMELKKQMAAGVVTKYWSKDEAVDARASFENRFQKQDYSGAEAVSLPAGIANPLWIVELLKLLNAITSTSEAKRLIEAGAVHLNDEAIKDFRANVTWQS